MIPEDKEVVDSEAPRVLAASRSFGKTQGGTEFKFLKDAEYVNEDEDLVVGHKLQLAIRVPGAQAVEQLRQEAGALVGRGSRRPRVGELEDGKGRDGAVARLGVREGRAELRKIRGTIAGEDGPRDVGRVAVRLGDGAQVGAAGEERRVRIGE